MKSCLPVSLPSTEHQVLAADIGPFTATSRRAHAPSLLREPVLLSCLSQGVVLSSSVETRIREKGFSVSRGRLRLDTELSGRPLQEQ